LQIPDDDSAAALYELTQEMTQSAGRPAYEVSNHARPGAECRHNLLYWQYGEYAGVGPGAHGRLTVGKRKLAISAERLPERWARLVAQQGHGFVAQDEIPELTAAREHLLMNLRLNEGLDIADFKARWGISLEPDRIRELTEEGFLRTAGQRLATTAKGRIVLNAVIAALSD
jgi:oxygen-independent coproporphyrinogen-3 oxidase